MKTKIIFIKISVLLLFIGCRHVENKSITHQKIDIQDSVYFKYNYCKEDINKIPVHDFYCNLFYGTTGDADFQNGFGMYLTLIKKNDSIIIKTNIRITEKQGYYFFINDSITTDRLTKTYYDLIQSSDPMKLRCIKGKSFSAPTMTGFEGYEFLFMNSTDTNMLNIYGSDSKYITINYLNIMGLFGDTTLFAFTKNQIINKSKYTKIKNYVSKLINSNRKTDHRKPLHNFSKSIGY